MPCKPLLGLQMRSNKYFSYGLDKSLLCFFFAMNNAMRSFHQVASSGQKLIILLSRIKQLAEELACIHSLQDIFYQKRTHTLRNYNKNPELTVRPSCIDVLKEGKSNRCFASKNQRYAQNPTGYPNGYPADVWVGFLV